MHANLSPLAATQAVAALAPGEGREREGPAGRRGGLPVSIEDLTHAAGVRTTRGSSVFRGHEPARWHPAAGLDRMLPIDPRPGTVPPASLA